MRLKQFLYEIQCCVQTNCSKWRFESLFSLVTFHSTIINIISSYVFMFSESEASKLIALVGVVCYTHVGEHLPLRARLNYQTYAYSKVLPKTVWHLKWCLTVWHLK